MALPACLSFSVKRCGPELVVPAKPTPHELKKLSDIDDQEGLRFQIPFIMFYRKSILMEGKDPVRVIREALAQALVYYYPFAGRLREGPDRKLMVDCSSEGVLFIEADADISLEELGDDIQPPFSRLEELLHDVPGSADIVGCPLLLIQVTRLKCGGFIFAVRLNHVLSDSLGLAQFLSTVGEFAKGSTKPSLLPVWQRDILCRRDPPRVTCVHHEYEQLIDARSAKMTMDYNNMVHQSVFISYKDLKSIRNKHLPSDLRKCTNSELLAACLWRCRTIALDLHPNEIVRMSYMINARGKGLELPPGYYGNSFAFPAALSKAKLLCENPLGYALELVQMIKAQMSAEYIRSVADLMVIKGRPHYTRVWNFLVADIIRAGLHYVDFGWGKPIYGGPARAFPCISIYGRFKNSEGEEGIVVPIWLPLLVMERFKEELVKMTQEPLDAAYVHTRSTSIKSSL